MRWPKGIALTTLFYSFARTDIMAHQNKRPLGEILGAGKRRMERKPARPLKEIFGTGKELSKERTDTAVLSPADPGFWVPSDPWIGPEQEREPGWTPNFRGKKKLAFLEQSQRMMDGWQGERAAESMPASETVETLQTGAVSVPAEKTGRRMPVERFDVRGILNPTPVRSGVLLDPERSEAPAAGDMALPSGTVLRKSDRDLDEFFREQVMPGIEPMQAAADERARKVLTEQSEARDRRWLEHFNIDPVGDYVADAVRTAATSRSERGPARIVEEVLSGIDPGKANAYIADRLADDPEFAAAADRLQRVVPAGGEVSDEEIERLQTALSPAQRKQYDKAVSEEQKRIVGEQEAFQKAADAAWKRQAQQFQQGITERLVEEMARRNMPESELDAFTRIALNASVPGMLTEWTVSNAARGDKALHAQIMQRALEKYDPSIASRIGGEVAGLLSSGPVFAAGGALGKAGAAGLRRIAERSVIKRLMARGITEGAEGVARRLVAGSPAQRLAQGLVASGTTLSTYDTVATPLAMAAAGENPSFGDIIGAMGRGFATGALLPGIGMATGRVADAATSRLGRYAAELGGFAAENAAFVGMGTLYDGLRTGEWGSPEQLAEDFAHSVGVLGIMKSVGALKRGRAKNPGFYDKVIAETEFTPEEVEALGRAGVDGRSYKRAVFDLLNAKETASGREVAERAAKQLGSQYADVMRSPEVPVSAKAKLMYLVEGRIPERLPLTTDVRRIVGEDGRTTVDLLDPAGNLVQRRAFSSEKAAEAFERESAGVREVNSIQYYEALIDRVQAFDEASQAYAVERGVPVETVKNEVRKAVGGQPYDKELVRRVVELSGQAGTGTVDVPGMLAAEIGRKHGLQEGEFEQALARREEVRTPEERAAVAEYAARLKEIATQELRQEPTPEERAERQLVEVAEQAITQAQNRDDGVVYTATMQDGRQANIIKGANLVYDPETGEVDATQSDPTVVVRYEDGEMRQVSVREIDMIVEAVSTDDARAEALKAIREQLDTAAREEALAEVVETGGLVQLKDGRIGAVEGVNEDGSFNVAVQDAEGRIVTGRVEAGDIVGPVEEESVPETVGSDGNAVPAAADAADPLVGRSLTDEEARQVIGQMEAAAEPAPELELTPENWVAEFGEEGKVQTPVGEVKMGENQLAKLFLKGRSAQFGMVKPTLETPDCVIEIPTQSKDGNTERPSSLLFVKAFTGKDGQKHYFFTSVTVQKDDMEVSVSNHLENRKRIIDFLKKGKLLYRVYGGAQTEQRPADVSVTASPSDMQGFSGEDTTTVPENQIAEAEIPRQKNGQPDFNAMPADMLAVELSAAVGHDKAVERLQVARGVNAKSLDKLRKSLDGMGDLNKAMAVEQQIAAMQQEDARLAGALEQLGAVEESVTGKAPAENFSKEIERLFPEGLPNVRARVLADIARGQRFVWNDSPDGTKRGVATELGFTGNESERRARFGMLGSEATGAKHVSSYVHDLWEDSNGYALDMDDAALRDEVIDVLLATPSRASAMAQLRDMAARHAEDDAAPRDAEDLAAMEAYDQERNNSRTEPVIAEQPGPDDVPFSVVGGASAAPAGVTPERWNVIVDQLRRVIGAENVVTDPEAVRAAYERIMGRGMEIRRRQVAEANERYNKQLDLFTEGKLPSGVKIDLGYPGVTLLACGIRNADMMIAQRVLKDHMEKHGLTADDIRNLPAALENPIMVYEWGDKAKTTIVITEIPRETERIAVALRFRQTVDGIKINKVVSVHGKSIDRLLTDMNTPLTDFGAENLKWVDKEKASDWLVTGGSFGPSASDQRLVTAVKIVTNFDNPKIGPENIVPQDKKTRYFRTPEGEVYGFTAGGKIYLDSERMNAATPMHEYTELWSQIVARENPAWWNRAKEIMRGDTGRLGEIWQEVNADPNYRDLGEDLRASETLSRATGEWFARKQAGIRDHENLFAVLKRLVREFWRKLKSAFAKWSDKELARMKADDVMGAPLKDFVEGIDLTKYRDEKTLAGVHNISAEKLKKAIKQGGLANPSAAVIDVEKQSHEGYGEISLILPSSLVDKRAGRNAGTWTADAWTPTYPDVERQFSDDGGERFARDMQALPKAMYAETRMGMNDWLDGRGSRQLAYMFLHERGEAPELQIIPARYGDATRKAVENATQGAFDLYNAGPEERQAVLEAYIGEKFGGDRAAYEQALAGTVARMEGLLNHERAMVRRRAAETLAGIRETGFDYNELSDFARSVGDDVRRGGKADAAATNEAAVKQIEDNGLQGEFDKWVDGFEERYGVREVLFDGFTPSGTRRYLPNTLENASKMMKTAGRNGATGMGFSFSNFAARLLDSLGSLKDIRARKGSLTTNHEEVDAFRDRWSQVFFDLGEKCQPDAEGYDDYGLYRLAEAARKRDPQAYLKKEYGVELSDEDTARLKEMVKAIRTEFPAMYFETKFERPVYLNEMAGAVVPENTDKDILDALDAAGIPYRTYGAAEERPQVIRKFSEELEGVRFSTNGEKARIREQARRDGTYLKAPNGQPSKLTADQWETVRTRQFKEWFGDWENEPENASKIVDENGEPMVVYHGTPLSRNQITPNRGWHGDDYVSQEAPFHTFRGGEYSGLIFTSVDYDQARIIASRRSMEIPDDERGNEQWTEEGYVYDLYANVKKPFDPQDRNAMSEVLHQFGDKIPTLSFYGGKGDSVSPDVALKMAASESNSWMLTETPEFLSKVKELGYDGLVGYDEWVKYIAVVSPDQIKSATENIGAFDPANPDIRFNREFTERRVTTLEKLENKRDALIADRGNIANFDERLAAVDAEIESYMQSDPVAETFGKDGANAAGNAHLQAVEDAVYDMQREMNIPTPTVVVRNADEFIARLREMGATDEQLKGISLEHCPNGIQWRGEIVIRGDAVADKVHARVIYIHEQAHDITEALFTLDELYDAAEEMGADYMNRRLEKRDAAYHVDGASEASMINGANEMISRGVELLYGKGLLAEFFATENGPIYPVIMYMEEHGVPSRLKDLIVENLQNIKADQYGTERTRQNIPGEVERQLDSRLFPAREGDGTADETGGRTGTAGDAVPERIGAGAAGVATDAGGRIGGRGGDLDRPSFSFGDSGNDAPKLTKQQQLIADLRRAVRESKAAARSVAQIVSRRVRKEVGTDLVEIMGKREFDAIVRQIEEATARQEVEKPLQRIAEVVTDLEIKRLQKVVDDFLKLKVQGEGPRGVSVAKEVDDRTRRMFEIFRNNLDRPAAEVAGELREQEDADMLYDLDAVSALEAYQEAVRYGREVDEIDREVEALRARNTQLRRERIAANKVGHKELFELLKKQILYNNELIDALEAERVETKGHRAGALKETAGLLSGQIGAGREILSEWKKQEEERRKKIVNDAFRDVDDGSKIPVLDKRPGVWTQGYRRTVEFLLSPAYSMDYLLKTISVNAPKGEGALYDHFMRGTDGYVEARGRYYLGYEDFKRALDEKARAVFGKSYPEVVADSNVPTEATITITNAAPRKPERDKQKGTDAGNPERVAAAEEYNPTIGEALYIYMTNKMTDGQVKLKRMGITEEEVDALVGILPARYVQFADWLQNEFLPERRKTYNATHLAVFGTQMARIENYVPLKIQKSYVRQEVDGSEPDPDTLPSAITGSIIRRTRNNQILNLHTNALDLMLEHGQQMEHWNAFTRVVLDMNALLTSTKFRRMLDTRNPGLHKRLKVAAQLAADSYRPQANDVNRAWIALGKLAASSKIAFRVNTALKQVLSYPAFYAYSPNPKFWAQLTKNLAPTTWAKNFRWCIDNIPSFRERWLGRMAGNEKLAQMTAPLLDKWLDKMNKYGMMPNAFVDALTCANGAKAVYDFRRTEYMERGKSAAEAERMARIDAAVSINTTQQSSEGMYIGQMQADRDFWSVSMSTFQNSNFAYLRKQLEGIDELFRDTMRERRNRTEYYKEQGFSDDEASDLALKEVVEAKLGALFNIVVFMFGLNILWGLGNNVWKYLFAPETRDEIPGELAKSAFVAAVRNTTVGSLAEGFASGYGANPSVLLSDMISFTNRLWRIVKKENPDAWNETAAYLALQTLSANGLGIDLESFVNMYQGITGMIRDGVDVEDLMWILNAPQSQAKLLAGKPKEGETEEKYHERMIFIERRIAERVDKKRRDKWTRNYTAYRQAEALGIQAERDIYGNVTVPELKQLDAEYAAALKNSGVTAAGGMRTDYDWEGLTPEQKKRWQKRARMAWKINKEEKELDAVIVYNERYAERMRELMDRKREYMVDVENNK